MFIQWKGIFHPEIPELFHLYQLSQHSNFVFGASRPLLNGNRSKSRLLVPTIVAGLNEIDTKNRKCLF